MSGAELVFIVRRMYSRAGRFENVEEQTRFAIESVFPQFRVLPSGTERFSFHYQNNVSTPPVPDNFSGFCCKFAIVSSFLCLNSLTFSQELADVSALAASLYPPFTAKTMSARHQRQTISVTFAASSLSLPHFCICVSTR